MMLSTIIGVSLTIVLCATVASATIEPYIQRAVISDDIRARVAAMSLEEKVGQTLQLDIQAFMKNPSVSLDVDTDKLGKFFDQYRMGSILNAPSSGGPVAGQATPDAAGWRQIITQVQQVATTRGSKIPVLYGLDTVHGANYIAGAALFPHQLGLAATFNRTHAQLCGASGARDTRYVGIPWVFSPILDLASHQLWPRFMETFGEDPLLVSEMGRAIIEGYQGDGTASSVSRNDKVLACMKHFIGYPNPRNGADRGAVWTPDLHLRNLYVPSFQAAVDANVRTAMSAYHELNGQPIGISNKYLTQLLRNEMGFKGMMVTDYNVLTDIHDLHHAAADHTTATNLMFNRTSIDMIMLGGNGDVYFNAMVSLVKTGVVAESRLDQSVQLIMQMKKDTGLLDTTPGPFPPNIPNPVGSQQSYNEVMDSIRESVVLLKNSGGVLPLPLTEAQRTLTSSQVWSAPVRRVLVTGPSSNSLPFQTGGWTIHWQGADKDSDFQLTGQATLLQGIQKIAGSRGVTVDYQSGCNIDGSYTQAQMDAALAAARQADVIIVAIGEKAYAEAPGNIDNLDLPEGQRTLVTNLAATGVPIVTILFEGRPRILHAIPEQSKAVIHAILPGPLAGVPIAEILFGITNPSGRLPFTYPSAINQIPLNYWHTASMANTVAQWNFGTGLSYSTFEYSNLRLSASTISFGQPVQVTVTVTNRGPMWGREAVLMFLSDDFRTIAPEAKLLKGFTKIYLQNGQQTDVTFTIKPRDMQFYGLDDTKLTQESGTFTVAIDKLSAQFTLNV